MLGSYCCLNHFNSPLGPVQLILTASNSWMSIPEKTQLDLIYLRGLINHRGETEQPFFYIVESHYSFPTNFYGSQGEQVICLLKRI